MDGSIEREFCRKERARQKILTNGCADPSSFLSCLPVELGRLVDYYAFQSKVFYLFMMIAEIFPFISEITRPDTSYLMAIAF